MRPRLLRLSLLFALTAGLAGCLQPVNAPGLGLSSTSARLADVSVNRVEGYLGYQLKSELDYLLSGGAAPKAARYQLNVSLTQTDALSIIDLSTGQPQASTVQVQARYELKDLKTGKLKGSGLTYASASYDRSQQRFSSLRAQRDAEERVAKSMAERLRIIVVTLLGSDTPADVRPAPALSPPIDPNYEKPADEPGDDS